MLRLYKIYNGHLYRVQDMEYFRDRIDQYKDDYETTYEKMAFEMIITANQLLSVRNGKVKHSQPHTVISFAELLPDNEYIDFLVRVGCLDISTKELTKLKQDFNALNEAEKEKKQHKLNLIKLKYGKK
jgi:hypothetical protein